MATYPYSVARMAQPNGPQLKKKDDPRIQAIRRRLQARNQGSTLPRRAGNA